MIFCFQAFLYDFQPFWKIPTILTRLELEKCDNAKLQAVDLCFHPQVEKVQMSRPTFFVDATGTMILAVKHVQANGVWVPKVVAMEGSRHSHLLIMNSRKEIQAGDLRGTIRVKLDQNVANAAAYLSISTRDGARVWNPVKAAGAVQLVMCTGVPKCIDALLDRDGAWDLDQLTSTWKSAEPLKVGLRVGVRMNYGLKRVVVRVG